MPTKYFSGYNDMGLMAAVDSEGNSISGSFADINSKIPDDASSQNKLVTKAELAGFGYKVSTADPETGYPDEENPSPHKVYLIKDTEATGDDKYAEWVWSVPEGSSEGSWEMIGDTGFVLDIDTETFTAPVMVDENTPLLADDGVSMVLREDATLARAINGLELSARRAYEDEYGDNIAEAISGKQDRLSANESDARKCLGVKTNGSIGWIDGNSLPEGGMLADGDTVAVPNNARSFLVTSRQSVTLEVRLDSGEIPNFVVEVTTGAAVTVSVRSVTGEFSAPLKYSAASGNELGAGKTYQVTAAGTCWRLEEFVRPSGSVYDFGGVGITFDQDGGHVSLVNDEEHVDVSEPVPVASITYNRQFTVGYNTVAFPFAIDTDKISSGTFYGIEDVIINSGKNSLVLSDPVSRIEANRPYVYVATVSEFSVQLDPGEYVIVEPSTNQVIPMDLPSGYWEFCSTYDKVVFGELPGFNVTHNYYGIIGRDTGSFHAGDLAKPGPYAYTLPMRWFLRRPL